MSLPPLEIGQTEVMFCGEMRPTYPLYTEFCWQSSFTGYPSVSVPCGLTSGGMPIGVLINAGKCKEALAYRVARALEKELDLRLELDMPE